MQLSDWNIIIIEAIFVIFTAVKILVAVFCAMTPAVWCCGRIPTFQRSMLPSSSGWNEDGGSTVFRNVDIPPKHHTTAEKAAT
jgi:hypothetical protein